jgi:hypothetical protein
MVFLHLVAFYLLPWAKLTDFATHLMVQRRPSWAAKFWYISATLFVSICFAHIAVLTWLVCFGVNAWGLYRESPCVCEAQSQRTSYKFACIQFETGSVLLDCLSVCEAFLLLVTTIVSCCRSVLLIVWTRPMLCAGLCVLSMLRPWKWFFWPIGLVGL